MSKSCRIAVSLNLLLALTGCERHQKPKTVPRNVVFVLIDTLRADHLGCYGYSRNTSPNLDAFAAQGVRFQNAISSTPWTLPSMATIWTSLYPSVHGAMKPSAVDQWRPDRKNARPSSVLPESRTTLAEVLHGAGFQTVAYVDGVYSGSIFGLAQGFDRFVEDDAYGVRLNTEALLDWIDRRHPRRFFGYVHVVEVHSPYTPPGFPRELGRRHDPQANRVRQVLPEERQRLLKFDFDPGYQGSADGSRVYLRELALQKNPDPRDVEHLVALYDRGIAYTDWWLGKFFENMQARGLFDDTLVIVTADHGEEFLGHGGLEHGLTYFEEMLHVPLLMHVPGIAPGMVIEQQVGLIDLMPTILDLLGVPSTLPMEGGSLRPLLEGGSVPERPVFAEAAMVPANRAAARTNDRKFVMSQLPSSDALYDLAADPGERENLCKQPGSDCAAWRQKVLQWRREQSAVLAHLGSPTPVAAAVDAQTRERLHALGYTE